MPDSGILILSAAIGEGHDLPARVLRDGILAERPDAYVEVRDALAEAPRMVRWIAAQEIELILPRADGPLDAAQRIAEQ